MTDAQQPAGHDSGTPKLPLTEAEISKLVDERLAQVLGVKPGDLEKLEMLGGFAQDQAISPTYILLSLIAMC